MSGAELAVTFDQVLTWAGYRGATVKAMAEVMGCSRYRFYRLRKDPHPFCRLLILEAAARCLAARGLHFQTTLLHFTGPSA